MTYAALTPAEQADGATLTPPSHDCYVEYRPGPDGQRAVYYPDLAPIYAASFTTDLPAWLVGTARHAIGFPIIDLMSVTGELLRPVAFMGITEAGDILIRLITSASIHAIDPKRIRKRAA